MSDNLESLASGDATLAVDAPNNVSSFEPRAEETDTHSGNRPVDMTRLVAQIQSGLPPELSEMILEFTLASSRSSSNLCDAPPAKILAEQHLRGVKVDARYRPPAFLRLSRKYRELFARSYYTNTVFHVKKKLLVKWLRSLPPHHANLLTEVRFYHIKDGLDSGDLAMDRLHLKTRSLNRRRNDYAVRDFAGLQQDISKSTTVDLGKGVIYMRIITMDGLHWLWWNGGMPTSTDGADADTTRVLCKLSTKYSLTRFQQ